MCAYHLAPQVWEWELLGACLAVFNQLVGGLDATLDSLDFLPGVVKLPSSSLATQLSEKGVLQLLFDARLLRDVLAGGRQLVRNGASSAVVSGGVLLDPQDTEALAAMAERRKTGTVLEQQLQVRH